MLYKIRILLTTLQALLLINLSVCAQTIIYNAFDALDDVLGGCV